MDSIAFFGWANWFDLILVGCVISLVLFLRKRITGLRGKLRRFEDENRLLKLERDRFLLFFEIAPSPCCIYDMQGVFVGVNEKYCQKLQLRKGDVIGKNSMQLGLISGAESFDRIKRELLEEGEIARREMIVDSAQGPEDALCSARIINFDGEELIFFSCVETIGLRRAKAALAASEESFNRLFQSAPIPLAYSNDTVNYTATTWNDAWYKTFGYSRQEADGKSGLEVGLWVTPGDRKQFLSNAGSVEGSEPVEVQMRHRDGSVRHCMVYGSFIGKPGQQILMVAYLDVSHRKQSEEERQKLHDQLAISQKLESVGQLAGGVAHDYNNMLGVIIGHTELATIKASKISENPLEKHHHEILKAAKRSTELTQQLLAFARKQTIVPKLIDINDCVNSTLQMLRYLIGENIELDWLPSKQKATVMLDPGQLDQMLMNLSVNGRDAIAGAGKITIETERVTFDIHQCRAHSYMEPGNYVMLSVTDNGCGMDTEIKSKIFEPFYTTKGLHQGTGLGLATVYGIVKQNNGFINVYSEPGKGSCFRIYLPWGGSGSTETSFLADEALHTGKGELILVVEDEQVLLDINTIMLEDLGYKVIGAELPSKAIQIAEQYKGKIDLLLTDVVMPEMNGRDLAKEVGAGGPEMACLFMSGYSANVISNHGVLEEGVCFIQKPFTMKQLGVKVHEALTGV